MLSAEAQIVVTICGVVLALIGLGNTFISAVQAYYLKLIDANLKLQTDYQIVQGQRAADEVKAATENIVDIAKAMRETAIAANMSKEAIERIDELIKNATLVPIKVSTIAAKRLAELSGKNEDIETAIQAEKAYQAKFKKIFPNE